MMYIVVACVIPAISIPPHHPRHPLTSSSSSSVAVVGDDDDYGSSSSDRLPIRDLPLAALACAFVVSAFMLACSAWRWQHATALTHTRTRTQPHSAGGKCTRLAGGGGGDDVGERKRRATELSVCAKHVHIMVTTAMGWAGRTEREGWDRNDVRSSGRGLGRPAGRLACCVCNACAFLNTARCCGV